MLKIFDRKLDYTALLTFSGFVYWMLADYYTNWLAPAPGVDYRMWIPLLAEILSNYLDIRVATRGLLVSKALWLCEEWKSVQTGIYPTLRDVYRLIRNIKYPLMSHQARHRETIINRLEGLLALYGDHICSQRPLD